MRCPGWCGLTLQLVEWLWPCHCYLYSNCSVWRLNYWLTPGLHHPDWGLRSVVCDALFKPGLGPPPPPWILRWGDHTLHPAWLTRLTYIHYSELLLIHWHTPTSLPTDIFNQRPFQSRKCSLCSKWLSRLRLVTLIYISRKHQFIWWRWYHRWSSSTMLTI